MKYFALTLAASLAIASNSSAFADTTTTTTTVETTSTEFALPSGGTYVVVDPTSGLSGAYDVTTRLINGRPLPIGGYVIDQSSGKVLATVDSSGNFVAFSTIPTALPRHFFVVNGSLMYFASDFDMRRAQLDAEISADYNSGRLSNRQVKDLREKLSEVAALESKRRDDGTYSSSTARAMERKLALVQGELARDVADISSKRARIGLKVE